MCISIRRIQYICHSALPPLSIKGFLECILDLLLAKQHIFVFQTNVEFTWSYSEDLVLLVKKIYWNEKSYSFGISNIWHVICSRYKFEFQIFVYVTLFCTIHFESSTRILTFHHLSNPRMHQSLLGRKPPSRISPQQTLNKIFRIIALRYPFIRREFH